MFQSADLMKNTVFNSNETHFIFDLRHRKLVKFKNESGTNYAEMSNITERMTNNANFESEMIEFVNSNNDYPSFRRDWGDRRVLTEC